MIRISDYEYFKWVAIIPGIILGGPVGGIIAFFLVQFLTFNKNEDLTFDIALLRICTLLIKADGKVDDIEVKVVRTFFYRTFGRRKSDRVFREVKISKLRNYTLEQLVNVVRLRLPPSKYYSVLQMLYAIAASDGSIARNEDTFIEDVALQFGFNKSKLQTIRNQFIMSKSKSNQYDQKIVDSFNVLGLKPGADENEIKASYRSLVKEYHPDKLIGMSDGIKQLAKEKFQMIQEAYEYLNKNYLQR
tara:strand:- start:17716 stop:18453 length:738 start_codon:yes stop_codon:yes gene_type:complete